MTDLEMIDRAYTEHRQAFEVWEHGEPVRAWHEAGCDICIEYESGKWWHYKNLDLPFITWWQDIATNTFKGVDERLSRGALARSLPLYSLSVDSGK